MSKIMSFYPRKRILLGLSATGDKFLSLELTFEFRLGIRQVITMLPFKRVG